MDYLLVALILLLGGTMLFKPELVWKLEGLLLNKRGEPPAGYFVAMRFWGVFFLFFAVLGGIYMAMT